MVRFLSNKKAKRIGAAALGVLIIAGSVLGIGYGTGLFKSNNSLADTDNGSGFTVSDTINNGISLTAMSVQGSGTFNNKTYESYTTVNGTISPSDATELTITWSLSWASANSAAISDYVALSATTSSSGEAITVYCYQPFSTQIVLTATSDGTSSDGAYLKSAVTFDYVARMTGYNAYYNLSYYDDVTVYNSYVIFGTDSVKTFYSGGSYHIFEDSFYEENDENFEGYSITGICGNGTLIEDYTYTVTLSFADDVKNDLETTFGVSDYEYTLFTSSNNGDTFTVDDIFADLVGSMSINSNKNTVYNSVNGYFESSVPIFKITLDAVGSVTGFSYTYDSYVMVDPSSYYISVSSITVADSCLYF